MKGSPKTLFISFDCEAIHSRSLDEHPLINIGFAAYTEDKTFVSELSVNLKGGKPDPDTLEWWTTKNKEAYEVATKDPLEPEEAMKKIQSWFKTVTKGYNPLLVCYPTIYDGSILYYYWMKFLGHPSGGVGPGFSVIDIRSYASGKLGISYFEASKGKALAKYRPSEDAFPHTHTGLDDAKEQIFLFFNIRDNITNK